MSGQKQTFIYFDLNKLSGQESYSLKNSIVIGEIKKAYGNITDGMSIWLYSDTFNEQKKFDPMVYLGMIHTSEDPEEYMIKVDEDDMEYLSKSEKFKDYSIQDVIGVDPFNSMKVKHPEWF